MRIGIVSQFYPPEPVFIPGSLAAELADRGHRVRVLTGFPNYPIGELYPGTRQRWHHSSRVDGVTVRRVPLYPSHDSSPARRAANYLSFAATSTAAAVRYLADADVIYVYHPPGTSFAPAALLRLVDRVPVVLHVQDLWPDAVTAFPAAPRGRPGQFLERVLAAVMRGIYRAASAMVVTAPTMRELLIERGADAAKVQLVFNWTDESVFRPVPRTGAARSAIGHRGRCTVMHAGNIGPFQNAEAAIRAAAHASNEMDLVFVGSGLEEESARRLAIGLGAGNVRFLGRRKPTEMAALYGAADFQLISLRDIPVLRGAIPSKLPAALSCGAPVLASTPGDSARLVTRSGAGLVCPPDDWAALTESFRRAAALSAPVREGMGRRGRDSYRRQMSMSTGVDQIETILIDAATGRVAT